MPLFRPASWTLLAATGFALVAGSTSAPARQPANNDLPRQPPAYREVSVLKTARGLSDQKKAKEAFAAFAQYNAEYISHPRVYTAPQEFRPEPAPPGSPPPPSTADALITELNRHILVPFPIQQSGPIVTQDEADYIRELGAALDVALKDVIEKNPERVVRVNATRMLAAACRSGATAHYPTVTGLITNPANPPEVKYYALQAAANLLAAYDLNDYRSRKHSNKPKEVAALIAAVQDAILNPDALVPAPAGAALPPDQLQVRGFIRRQAVRALAQVRFAEFKVPDGPTLYPAFTLAQVAVSDPVLAPPPAEAEIAEAVIGICNMTPPRGQAAQPYAYAMADAIATGLITFATPRAASPADKSLPWRGYAARLNDALKLWRGLFDANFDPARPTGFAPGVAPKPVEDLAAQAESRVLSPMDGAGPIDVKGLRLFRDDKNIRGDSKWTLTPFGDNPKLVIPKKN
ncbi:MAG: hypothetical protein JWO38_4910 [Gemmataceae bacterium]|nr:hypothetical protein [Gemmataceae bacterium]